jgi:hypothetical protein
MSWLRPGLRNHDGFVIGLHEDPPGLLRPLERKDPDGISVRELQAACSCGWRSVRFTAAASAGAAWIFGTLDLCEQDEDKARALWVEHANQTERARSAALQAAGDVLQRPKR